MAPPSLMLLLVFLVLEGAGAETAGAMPGARCSQEIVVENLVAWTGRAERLSLSVQGLSTGAQLTGQQDLLEAIEILAGDGGTLAEDCRLCGAGEISRKVARLAHYLGANARRLKSAEGRRADRLLGEIVQTLAQARRLHQARGE